MKYYVIAGEASGDLHGSNLIKSIKKIDDNAQIRAWGGDKIENAGAELVMHYRETAIMGFIEVLKNIRKISGFFKLAKSDIMSFKPDVIIFVDYPGFNLRMAEWAHNNRFKTVYYITPSVWAWNKSRAKKLKKYVDLSIPILPFEKKFLDTYGVNSLYCGNPVVDAVEEYRKSNVNHFHEKTTIAILPGSRVQEITRMLPTLLKGAYLYDNKADIVISKMKSIDDDVYYDAIHSTNTTNINFHDGNPYDLILESKVALVASGTATLEVALLKTPQIVCYIGSAISVSIAKLLLDIKHISLPNLIMGRTIVPELIQNDCTPEIIKKTIEKVLSDEAQIKSDYEALTQSIGPPGASEKAAQAIFSLING